MHKIITCFCAVILAGGIFIVAACSEQPEMTGTYLQVSGAASVSLSIITLEETREGIWETDLDEISFRWSVRDSEIWLHTKTGGVITGKITDQGFIMELPETGSLVFRRED